MQPVVVIWGDFPQRTVETGPVPCVAGAALVEWLRSRPPARQELELTDG